MIIIRLIYLYEGPSPDDLIKKIKSDNHLLEEKIPKKKMLENIEIKKPNIDDFKSIKRGIKSLIQINAQNHVQALVIRDSTVIARETSKGTKKMLQLIKKSSNSKSILIKFPKKKQDLRIDLPTIGLDTLKDCRKFGIKGIVMKAKQNIFMDKNKSIIFANKYKIFISVK